jgi:hypothetical protein
LDDAPRQSVIKTKRHEDKASLSSWDKHPSGRVFAALAPRMATTDSFYSFKSAANRTVFFDRLNKILTT